MANKDRRDFLQAAGITGMFSAVSTAAMGQAASGSFTVDAANTSTAELPAKDHIKFAAIGLDHAHIYGMTRAVQRGGGKLVSFYATDPEQIAEFRKQFGDVKLASSEDEIMNDRTIQLVLAAPIPDLRAPLGVRVMRAGKDYLADKPGITTLEQLADGAQGRQETGRKFAIMYSERLEVRSAVYAGELIKQGAIGRVIQTVNLAPHRVNAPTRPAWFFDKARYGGILTDIGSHQADQFLLLHEQHEGESRRLADRQPRLPAVSEVRGLRRHDGRRATAARVTCASIGSRPMACRPGATAACSCSAPRVTSSCANTSTSPPGLQAAITCTSSTKSRRATSIASNVPLPFGPQFVSDIVKRTQIAQDQEQALLAAELVLSAQKNATRPVSGLICRGNA